MRGNAPSLSVRAHVEGAEGRGPRLDATFASREPITAIMGPSGAGKTTLLECIAGLVRPSSGRIVLDGELLFDSDARVFTPPHRRKVALLFQSFALFPHLSVWENVAYGVQGAHGKRGAARHVRRDLAMMWLERVRARTLAERAPSTLSGGEAQRVALARALASAPRLLLLDEPFSALNQELRRELSEFLRELVSETRVPVLLVTHDLADAQRMASRILHLDAGRVVADGAAPRAVVENEPTSVDDGLAIAEKDNP